MTESGGGKSVVEQTASIDVIGQRPQPESVAIRLEVGPLFLVVGACYFLMAVQREPSRHHHRARYHAVTYGLACLVEPSLQVEEGARHPPMPGRCLLVAPGNVKGVGTP